MQAYIFPGFIDAHNHAAYNVLPKWTPPKRYQNRGQWQRAQAYKQFKAPNSRLKDQDKLFCEMVKYGELRALLSGITTIQGTSPDQACFRTLIRNAENQSELPITPAHLRTYILDIRSFKGTVDWTVTRAFVVHLAEGIDPHSREEFRILKQKGLLTAQTAIIHGTAFEEAEFAEMAQVGAKLIWSPQSNLALYGQTTHITLAVLQGVPVSLGVDWHATGSDTLFDELCVASQLNRDQFGA
jgi:cytosine/adenosine deaminase-related metal-dependent hydrolase